jgi:hypothetical protein
MKRLFAAVGIAVALSTLLPVFDASAGSASAQEWRSRGNADSAADRDRDRGWRGQGNAGG